MSASIRTLIVDDEPLAIRLICKLLERHNDIDIVGTASDVAAADELIAGTAPDLVFLDIQMPRMDRPDDDAAAGMQIAELLAGTDSAPLVVFVTAHDEFAARAFDVDAVDYLVKPVDKTRFENALERVRRELAGRRQGACRHARQLGAAARTIVIRQRDEIVRLAESEIFWLEAASQYVRIHTTSSSFMVSESLNNYHKRLRSDDFIRVHRSAVVNRAHVVQVFRRSNGVHDLRLANGVDVPLSRSRRHLVSRFLRVADPVD